MKYFISGYTADTGINVVTLKKKIGPNNYQIIHEVSSRNYYKTVLQQVEKVAIKMGLKKDIDYRFV